MEKKIFIGMEPKVTINFIFDNQSISIYEEGRERLLKEIINSFCSKINRQATDFFFIYNGLTLSIDDSKRLRDVNDKDTNLNILVYSYEENNSNNCNNNNTDYLKESKYIICPLCKEPCEINIKDNKISVINCPNRHSLKDLSFIDFNKSQLLNESLIKCSKCNKTKKDTYENKFYACSCGKYFCPLCESTHKNKEHITIDYDKKYFYCPTHNEIFIYYCNDCQKSLCCLCETEHNKNHKDKTIFNEIIPSKEYLNELKTRMNEIKTSIDKFNKVIDEIVKRIYKVKEDFLSFYKINEKIIYSFDIRLRNYYFLKNIKNINESIKKNSRVVNNIDELIKEDNFEKIISKIMYNNNIVNDEQPITGNEKKYVKVAIIYDISKNKEKGEVKLFGKTFVENNKENCSIIINGQEKEICDNYKYKNNEINNNSLKIELVIKKDLTNMKNMFIKCSSLLSITDFSLIDTKKVFDMSNLFSGCISLGTISGISEWKTNNVKNMSRMFKQCRTIKVLPDISKWNTNKVEDMTEMFFNCESLITLPDISKWKINNVTQIYSMFWGDYSLKSIPDISKWDTSNIVKMYSLFEDCKSLVSLPNISVWNVKKVESMNYLFSGCSSLTSLPNITDWNTKKSCSFVGMFSNCSGLSPSSIPSKFK